MKTITKEIKKAIAYQYFDATYIYTNDFGTFRNTIGDFHTNDYIEKSSFRLLLKSLADISDEDAKFIGEIYYGSETSRNVKDGLFVIEYIMREKEHTCNYNKAIQINEYLKQKHYAISCMGYSVNELVELGVYKLTSSKQTVK